MIKSCRAITAYYSRIAQYIFVPCDRCFWGARAYVSGNSDAAETPSKVLHSILVIICFLCARSNCVHLLLYIYVCVCVCVCGPSPRLTKAAPGTLPRSSKNCPSLILAAFHKQRLCDHLTHINQAKGFYPRKHTTKKSASVFRFVVPTPFASLFLLGVFLVLFGGLGASFTLFGQYLFYILYTPIYKSHTQESKYWLGVSTCCSK